MKKFFLMFALAAAPFIMTGCSDDEEDDGGGNSSETYSISLSISGLEDNQATISVSLTSGTFYGAKLVEAISSDDVTVDLSSEIQLINYVIANGVDIELPYTNTLTDLRAGAEMFTAVIVYDSSGLAVTSEYETWTVVGLPDGWSDDNSAGNLDEITW